MTSDIHIAATKKLASIIEGQVVDGIASTHPFSSVDQIIHGIRSAKHLSKAFSLLAEVE